MNKMRNCTVVLFLDDTAMLPSFRMEHCVQQIKGRFLLVCGEWWWMRPDVREWIKYHQNKGDFKVGLLLCILEQIQGDGDICSTIEEVLDDQAPDLNYLGIWSQLLDGVPMSDSMNWSRGVPKLEGLYLEFVRLDASALLRMRRLKELRMFFDEWDTSNIAAFASMPELQTLFLEPAVEEIIQPSMLLGLGQNIRCLKVQGRMSTKAVSEHPVWADFMPELFNKLTSLQRFEASLNAADLVQAVLDILDNEHPPKDVIMVSSWVICKFKGLWVGLDWETKAFRGVFRTVDAARRAAGPFPAPEGFLLLF
ncbi:hypothetical protein COCOBI_12-3750 [Coccomyxa sp. Obi]|nr:hypothetical protein COCOBI_12-3750 [Coccomyxa sp. Obi]